MGDPSLLLARWGVREHASDQLKTIRDVLFRGACAIKWYRVWRANMALRRKRREGQRDRVLKLIASGVEGDIRLCVQWAAGCAASRATPATPPVCARLRRLKCAFRAARHARGSSAQLFRGEPAKGALSSMWRRGPALARLARFCVAPAHLPTRPYSQREHLRYHPEIKGLLGQWFDSLGEVSKEHGPVVYQVRMRAGASAPRWQRDLCHRPLVRRTCTRRFTGSLQRCCCRRH